MEIWKFGPLERGQVFRVHAPVGTMFTHFAAQGAARQMFVWAWADPNMPARSYELLVVGTGHEVTPDWGYVGTLLDDDSSAWHALVRLAQ